MPGIHWQEALRQRSFWLIAASGALGGASVSALLVLVVPYLESVGIAREQGAFGLTVLGTVSVAGRLGIGWLGDKADKRYLLAASYALTAVGIFAFAFVGSFWVAMVVLLLISPGYGAPVPGRPALLAQYFGRRHYGAIQGLQASIGTLGAVIAPWAAARIFDVTGSYRQAWILLAFVSVLGALTILLARPPRIREPKHRPSFTVETPS